MRTPSLARRTTCHERSSKARATDVKLTSGLFQLVNVEFYHDSYILSHTVFIFHFSHEPWLAGCPLPPLFSVIIFANLCIVSGFWLCLLTLPFLVSFSKNRFPLSVATHVENWVKWGNFEQKTGKIVVACSVLACVMWWNAAECQYMYHNVPKNRSCRTHDAHIIIIIFVYLWHDRTHAMTKQKYRNKR